MYVLFIFDNNLKFLGTKICFYLVRQIKICLTRSFLGVPFEYLFPEQTNILGPIAGTQNWFPNIFLKHFIILICTPLG